MTIIINTRTDLEALKGTPDYLPALRAIAGTMETMVNTAEYPEGYGVVARGHIVSHIGCNFPSSRKW